MKRILLNSGDLPALMALIGRQMDELNQDGPEESNLHESYDELEFDDEGWSHQMLHSCPGNVMDLLDTDIVRFNLAGAEWRVDDARNKGVFQQQFMFQLKKRVEQKAEKPEFKLQTFFAVSVDTFEATKIGDYPEMNDAVGAWVRKSASHGGGGFWIVSYEILEKLESAIDIAVDRERS